jgi:hypothetical protein
MRVPDGVEFALLHTLDDRWGLSPPWGACDSGCDLESSGDDVLRGWCHVDLRGAGAATLEDVPVAALLRSTWDALELFGTTTLTGVDTIVPLACAGDRLAARIEGSVVRDRARASDALVPVAIHAGPAWPSARPEPWDERAILERLSRLVEITASMDAVERVAYPAPTLPDPFTPSDPDLVRAEVVLLEWTIDDVAWLVEAMCASCREAGVRADVQVAVRAAPR